MGFSARGGKNHLFTLKLTSFYMWINAIKQILFLCYDGNV